jgi:regulator of sigma E protease
MEILAVDLNLAVNQIFNIALAALGLGLVIFLHELGHFAVAKWCDVFVERFSIGFGPVLFSRKWGETEYALSLIPFGGYVKMLGQDDADPSQLTSEEIAADPRSYIAKSVLQRMAIISAGVTMNVLTAFIFFIIVFMVGFPTLPSLIGDARPGMPAWEAGIAAGDHIDKINGGRISTFTDLQMSVALSSGPLRLEGEHANGEKFDITVDPDATGPHPQIGVIPMESLTVYDTVPGHAVAEGSPTFQKGDQILKVGDEEVKSAVEFHRAVAASTDNPLVITVKRTLDKSQSKLNEPTIETIKIADNYFRTLGLTLDSGPIVAVRRGSPAEKAGLQKGDKLAELDGLNIGTEIDPLKLPVAFAQRHGKKITVTVTRQVVGGGQEKKTVTLEPDDVPGWLDQPELPGEPLSIPSIGVAFHILPNVLTVTPDGPAAKAGVKPGPLKRMTLVKRPELKNSQDEGKDSTIPVKFDEGNTNNCAYAFWQMQCFPQRKVMLTFNDEGKQVEVEVAPELDREWHLPIVGVRFDSERLDQKADSIAEACAMSIKHTQKSALNIYLTLRSLVTRRVSYTELHGPIGIAKTAYRFAQEGWVAMLLFLGFLSVNLAVLNFLPIPVLDGGHMVFLIWEACTRRKPNEKVLIGATYVGFAFLLGLMALVLYLDLFIHPFSKK